MADFPNPKLPARVPAKPVPATFGLGVDIAALVATTVQTVVRERTEQTRIEADKERDLRRIQVREQVITHAFDARMRERGESLGKLSQLASDPAVLADTDSLAVVVNGIVQIVQASPFDGLGELGDILDDVSGDDDAGATVIEGELG